MGPGLGVLPGRDLPVAEAPEIGALLLAAGHLRCQILPDRIPRHPLNHPARLETPHGRKGLERPHEDEVVDARGGKHRSALVPRYMQHVLLVPLVLLVHFPCLGIRLFLAQWHVVELAGVSQHGNSVVVRACS